MDAFSGQGNLFLIVNCSQNWTGGLNKIPSLVLVIWFVSIVILLAMVVQCGGSSGITETDEFSMMCFNRANAFQLTSLDFYSQNLDKPPRGKPRYAPKVFLIRKEPLLMTWELSKSMRWSNDHACIAMFDPLAHVLTFLICTFLRVSKHRPVSPGIKPITIGTGYFINHVCLMLSRCRRKFSLQSLEGLIYNLNVVPSKNSLSF